MAEAPIDRLLARSRISARMHAAGQRLRQEFDVGVLGKTPTIDSYSAITSDLGEKQFLALTSYREVLRCLGAHVGAVVAAVCCYDTDVAMVAARQGRNRERVMGVLEDGLKTLADHYRMTGSDAPKVTP